MENEKTLVFGINPVREKLTASPQQIQEILIAGRRERPALRSLDLEARRLGVRVSYVNGDVLNRLAGGEKHQGVLARVEAYTYLPFAELAQRLSTSSGPDRLLILDGLTDPRNFGALLRTAEATGIQHVLIPKDRSVGVTPTAVKASAGAVHYLKLYKATNLRRAVATLKAHGFWIVGLDPRAKLGIHELEYPEKLGIVLGSEGKGVRPIILSECDYVVAIPMLGKIASLNVAVAGAVLLYELLRQRQSIDKAGGNR